jgi:hypothetical protein
MSTRFMSAAFAQPQGVKVLALDLVDFGGHRLEFVRDADVAAGQPIAAAGGKRLDQARGLVRVGAVAGRQTLSEPFEHAAFG